MQLVRTSIGKDNADYPVTIGPDFRLRLLYIVGGKGCCWRDPYDTVGVLDLHALPTVHRLCRCGANRKFGLRLDRVGRQNDNDAGDPTRDSRHMKHLYLLCHGSDLQYN